MIGILLETKQKSKKKAINKTKQNKTKQLKVMVSKNT